jgi:hypothetical protein
MGVNSSDRFDVGILATRARTIDRNRFARQIRRDRQLQECFPTRRVCIGRQSVCHTCTYRGARGGLRDINEEYAGISHIYGNYVYSGCRACICRGWN